METTLYKPKNYPARRPTETAKRHGRVLNPPGVYEIGGLDGLTNKAHKRNDLTLKKPGGTI